MDQLSGLDAAFVHQDSRRTPMHITVALLYNAGGDGRRSLSLDELTGLARERLEEFPLFRRRLRQVPMGMDTPYWVDVTSPRWRGHIHESSLPPGGRWRAFRQLLARLHGTRMDLGEPLWEMHLVHDVENLDGLPPHCQALVLKVHHSAIDGISMAAIINALHQAPPGDERSSRLRRPEPSPWELWARTNINNLNRQFKFAETVGNLLPSFRRAQQARREFDDLPPTERGASRFNDRVGAHRSVGSILLPMSEVRAVKRAVGRVTVNDIAMSCVAGALRQYLQYHGQLPHRSLVGGIPINLRRPDESRTGGNRIATMQVGLATFEGDPVKRLQLVHRYAVAGKKHIDALGTGTVMDISDSVAPAVLARGIKSIARASRLVDMPVPFHTMISNVPGPSGQLFLGDAEFVAPIGLGPLRDNMGLFHIVSNGPEVLSLSFSACRDMLPDPVYYEECLENAFAELQEKSVQPAPSAR